MTETTSEEDIIEIKEMTIDQLSHNKIKNYYDRKLISL